MKKEKDAIWQDLKITQQFIKQLAGSGDKVQLNVINIGQIKMNQSLETEDLHKMLEVILERLPEPRLKKLTKLAYEVGLNKLSTKTSAANWLGVSLRTLTGDASKSVELELM